MDNLAFEEIKHDKILEGDIISSFPKNHDGFGNKLRGLFKTWKWDEKKIWGIYVGYGVLIFRNDKILIYPFSYFVDNDKIKIVLRRNDQIFYRDSWNNCYDRYSVKKYAEYFYQHGIKNYNSDLPFNSDNFPKLCLMGNYYDERLEVQNNYPYYSFLSQRYF